MINANQFVQMFGNESPEKVVQFAKVAADYVADSGRPRVIFDGETVVSGKAYPYLSTYTPAPGDRVMIVRGVIIGKII